MNILVKPHSESDGNLVILADNTTEIHLVDLTTGEIIETGNNRGASNGRDSTVRFSQPGEAYNNVGVMDDQGNVLVTLETAGDRVQFNYSDYDALVQTPVSTIEGYRWDNSANRTAQQTGQPSNADIAGMTSEEYNAYLETQASEGGSSGGGGASAASTAASLVTADQVLNDGAGLTQALEYIGLGGEANATAQGVNAATQTGAAAAQGANATAQGVNATTQGVQAGVAAGGEAYAVGSAAMADGSAGVLMSDGTIQAANTTTNYGQIASDVGTVVGVAAAAYNGYLGATDYENLTPDERAQRARQAAARAVAAYFTAGISEAAAAAVDMVFGEGTTQETLDRIDEFASSDWGQVLLPGVGFTNDLLDSGLKKILGDQTKYSEVRELGEAYEEGVVNDEFFQNFYEPAKEFGGGNRDRSNIDPEAHYQASLESGMTEEQAQRQREYAQLVRDGNDDEAITRLTGRDIWGYGDVASAVSEMTGQHYTDGLTEGQREAAAQAILDHGALYSELGAYRVDRENEALREALAAIGSGETAVTEPDANTPQLRAPEPQPVVPASPAQITPDAAVDPNFNVNPQPVPVSTGTKFDVTNPSLANHQQEVPQGTPRSLVPSDAEPSGVSDFQHLGGGSLAAFEAAQLQKKLQEEAMKQNLALSMINGGSNSQITGQVIAEAFKPRAQQTAADIGFQQLSNALARG